MRKTPLGINLSVKSRIETAVGLEITEAKMLEGQKGRCIRLSAAAFLRGGAEAEVSRVRRCVRMPLLEAAQGHAQISDQLVGS